MMTAADQPSMILIVEDRIDNGNFLLDFLDFEGYRAQLVRTGAAAIRVLHTTPQLRAVILDYFLPDMTAEEVLAATAAVHGDIPVLMVTASYEVVARRQELSVAWVGLKPFNLSELLEHLASVLTDA